MLKNCLPDKKTCRAAGLFSSSSGFEKTLGELQQILQNHRSERIGCLIYLIWIYFKIDSSEKGKDLFYSLNLREDCDRYRDQPREVSNMASEAFLELSIDCRKEEEPNEPSTLAVDLYETAVLYQYDRSCLPAVASIRETLQHVGDDGEKVREHFTNLKHTEDSKRAKLQARTNPDSLNVHRLAGVYSWQTSHSSQKLHGPVPWSKPMPPNLDTSEADTTIASGLKCTHPGCDTITARRGDLNRHMLKHTGERRFSCLEPGCDQRSFHRRDKLVAHQRAKHRASVIEAEQDAEQQHRMD
jgi:hypothetical protein